jgi:mono/diheme cytochrome c family protein
MHRTTKAVVALVAAFLVIQIVRPARTNPPVDSAKTIDAHVDVPQAVDAILSRACADCHSNATRWPWYSQVAPVSWLLANDVNGGRLHLNFSDWEARHHHEESPFAEMCKQVRDRDMPPWYYLPLHPAARLTPADVRTICDWAATAKERSPEP